MEKTHSFYKKKNLNKYYKKANAYLGYLRYEYLEENNLPFENLLFYDLLTSFKSIIACDLSNNHESIGINLDARVLIECLTFYRVWKNNGFKDNQIAYLVYSSLFADAKFRHQTSAFPQRTPLDTEFDSIEKELLKQKGCFKEQLKYARKNQFDYKYFFGLNKNFIGIISLYQFVESYGEENYGKMHQFFSILNHPIFIVNKSYKEQIDKVREEYLNALMIEVIDIVDELDVSNINIAKSFAALKDYFKEETQLFGDLIKKINAIDKAYIEKYPKVDYMLSILRTVGDYGFCLFSDAYQVMNRYKLIFEQCAFFDKCLSHNDKNMFEKFELTSYVSLEDYLSKDFNKNTNMNKLFDLFKDEIQDDKKEFSKKIHAKSINFLNYGKSTTYTSIVQNYLDVYKIRALTPMTFFENDFKGTFKAGHVTLGSIFYCKQLSDDELKSNGAKFCTVICMALTEVVMILNKMGFQEELNDLLRHIGNKILPFAQEQILSVTEKLFQMGNDLINAERNLVKSSESVFISQSEEK